MEINVKKNVAYKAVGDLVKSGMKLGLGTGSTAIWAVRRVGELLKEGKLKNILAVPTSFQTEMECHKYNIPVKTLNDPEIAGHLDLAIDGADEVDEDFNLIKGGGGALLLEKIVEYSADRFAVIVDESKLKKNLGTGFKIPIEVIPLARESVKNNLEKLGAKVEVREAVKKIGPVITENGNMILDIIFDKPINPSQIENDFSSIPGVVEVGIFSKNVTYLYVGYVDGRVEGKEKV